MAKPVDSRPRDPRAEASAPARSATPAVRDATARSGAPVDRGAGTRPIAADRLPDDALETSKLLLELIHAAYATRTADTAMRPSAGVGGADARPAASPHAIRAAIHVYQHGERTIGQLAEGLGISYGWASRVVSELEESGMVTRSVDPLDRRVVRVSLTPGAMAMVEGAYRWRGDAVARALGTLDDRGRRAVRTFLRSAIDELTEAGRARGPRGG